MIRTQKPQENGNNAQICDEMGRWKRYHKAESSNSCEVGFQKGYSAGSVSLYKNINSTDKPDTHHQSAQASIENGAQQMKVRHLHEPNLNHGPSYAHHQCTNLASMADP